MSSEKFSIMIMQWKILMSFSTNEDFNQIAWILTKSLILLDIDVFIPIADSPAKCRNSSVFLMLSEYSAWKIRRFTIFCLNL